jgi:hypothetical protein
VNPFQRVTLYGPEIIQAYSGRRKGELEPHLFAIAEDAYTRMQKDGEGQTIIVSGERLVPTLTSFTTRLHPHVQRCWKNRVCEAHHALPRICKSCGFQSESEELDRRLFRGRAPDPRHEPHSRGVWQCKDHP